MNDLWEFDPVSMQWTWMSGSSTLTCSANPFNPGLCLFNSPGLYGTLSTPSAGNVPGGRFDASSWVDANGHLWLFGGIGSAALGQFNVMLNDLWEFDPS